MKKHWTNRSLEDYVFAIAYDFIVQLENKMEDVGLSQDELAKILGRSKGAVSQMLNNPKNPTLGKLAEYSKALNMKLAVIAYEDDDPENKKGPINPEIFKICWEKANKPRDFWELQNSTEQQSNNLQYITVSTLADVANNDIKLNLKGSDKPASQSVAMSGLALASNQ